MATRTFATPILIWDRRSSRSGKDKDTTLPQHKENAPGHWVQCKYCNAIHVMGEKAPGVPDGHYSYLSKIDEGIYLSNMCVAHAVMSGKEKAYEHITHVLSIYSGGTTDRTGLQPSSKRSHIVHKQIVLEDRTTTNLLEHFPEICYFLHSSLASRTTREDRPVNILVHCRAGASRSATAIMAYLIWARRWEVSTTLRFLKDKRRVVGPNSGFIQQLELWRKLECDLYIGDTINNEYERVCLVSKWERQKRTTAPNMTILTRSFVRPPVGHWLKVESQQLTNPNLDLRAWCAVYWKPYQQQYYECSLVNSKLRFGEGFYAAELAELCDNVSNDILEKKLSRFLSHGSTTAGEAK